MASLDEFDMDGNLDLSGDMDNAAGAFTDDENDSDYQDDEEYELEGAASLFRDSEDPDDLFAHSPMTANPKTRPAFFHRSNKAASRSAIRTQVSSSDSFLLIEDNTPEPHKAPARPAPGAFRKRRQRGTLPQFAKAVTAELDENDDLMMNLREQGYTDTYIAEKFLREGRGHYDKKSISTRIARIRNAQAAHVDTQLSEGWKEWELADDMRLMEAYTLADIEVQYEIERTRAWRFKKVADYMRRLDKESIFSEKACRKRYQELLDGTARIPTEEDDEPEQARMKLEKYRMEREEKRMKEQEEKEKKDELARKVKEEARIRQAHKNEQVAQRRHAKQQEKTERAMKRAAEAQMKAQRAEENRVSKVKKAEKIRREKAAKAQKALESGKGAASIVAGPKHVTEKTKDPRSVLSFDDLQKLCQQRALNDVDEARSTEELVQKLRDADDGFNSNQLKAMCRAQGLNQTGTKLRLKYELALNEARKFPSFDEDLLEVEDEEENNDDVDIDMNNNEPIDLLGGADDDEDEPMLD